MPGRDLWSGRDKDLEKGVRDMMQKYAAKLEENRRLKRRIAFLEQGLQEVERRMAALLARLQENQEGI